jgi:HK97 family phage portal protein
VGLRDTDHGAVVDFLRDLETKGASAGRFSGYGGASLASSGGSYNAFPYLTARPPGAKYDYQLEAGDLWRNTVAAIAFAWIKKNFPVPRMNVARRKKGVGWAEIEGHAAVEVLEEPNKFYDSDALWAATSVSFHTDGNAYWRKGQTIDGRTREFWYTPHWQMFPRWDSAGKEFITHYDYIVDGERYQLRPDQVVHFRNGIDIRNYRYGNTELGCAVREVCTDNEAASYEASILRNLGIPGFMLSPESDDDDIDEKQRKELKKLWRESFTGEGRGEILVNSVKVKLDKVTLTPEELTLDKIRQIPEARICAAIGPNPMTLGLSVGDSQRTYSNYGEARRASYEDCIVPLQRTFGRQFTRQCPELFRTGEQLRWDYTDVPAMQEDATNRAKRSVILYQGGLAKKGESRSMVGLPEDTADPDRDKYHQGEAMRGSLPMLGDNKMGDDAV